MNKHETMLHETNLSKLVTRLIVFLRHDTPTVVEWARHPLRPVELSVGIFRLEIKLHLTVDDGRCDVMKRAAANNKGPNLREGSQPSFASI